MPSPATCNAVGAACCPGNATDAPADLPFDQGGNKIKWCRGDKLICLPGKTWQDPSTCQPYPLVGCGQTGQACCTASYHNPMPPNKSLGPQCVGANDYCYGDVCKTIAPDCGALNHKACIGTPQANMMILNCKGNDLGMESLRTDVCILCPNGREKNSSYCNGGNPAPG